MEMINQDTTVIKTSPMAMGFAIQEMVQNGWEIDPEQPVVQLGFNWECGFKRVITKEQHEEELKEFGKPSRAEILAKARAAKAAKREVGNE